YSVDFYGKKSLAAMVFGMLEAETGRELVRSRKLPGRESIRFIPAGPGSAPRLAIEKPALGGLEHQTVRFIALRSDVRVKSFVAELRNKQSCRPNDITMLQVCLETSLMEVWCGCLRIEGIQTKVIKFLRIDRKGNSGRLLRCQIEVQLGIGVKAFEFGIAFERWEAVHRRANKPVFERLCDGDAVFDKWSRKCESWCCCADSRDDAIAVAQPRNKIL